MLTHLMRKGLISKSISAPLIKRKCYFTKGHAKPRLFKPYQDMVMSERIQIDHMTVTKSGITVKDFQAWERVSKYIHANVYSTAKSSSAQVNGVSEFRADFKQPVLR